jgi:methylthioribose-1-phosphate isomerase
MISKEDYTLIQLIKNEGEETTLFSLTNRSMHVKLKCSCALRRGRFFWGRRIMRTVEWDSSLPAICLIDQRWLPGRFEIIQCKTYPEVIWAIRDMVVRGAPAIGAAAAFGVALAAFSLRGDSLEVMRVGLRKAAAELIESRPTAVNLAWAVRKMMVASEQPAANSTQLAELLLAAAQEIADEDVKTNLRISEIGSALVHDGDTILHHCNTGALATVDWGTALGIIHLAHQQGKRIHVLVDETRPRLQGARLTAWELQQWGIPYEIISDGASGHFLRSGQVQLVLFGADRIAANGDVANKVGSYLLALAAHANRVPVYSVAPTSTVDLDIASGDLIEIEERDPGEVLDLEIHGQRVTPVGAKARNPAFDVTPSHLLSGIVTENGIVTPPFIKNLPRLVLGSKG